MEERKRELKEREERLNQLLEEQSSRYRVQYVSGLRGSLILDGYILKEENEVCCPIFYYNEEVFQKNDQELIEEMNTFFSVAKNGPVSTKILSNIDADYIYRHVSARFVPSERIESVKERGVYVFQWLDLGVSFAVDLRELFPEADEHGTYNVQITNALIDCYKIDAEKLLKSAFRNMEEQKYIAPIVQALNELTGREYEEVEPKMLIVSNEEKLYGASMIMLPSVIEQLQEIFGDSFVVLPSSVHECIVLGLDENDYLTLEGMTENVREINQTVVEEEDFLSDYVYYFSDGQMHRFDERCVA